MAKEEKTSIFRKSYIRISLFLLTVLTVAMMSRSALEHFFLYFPSAAHETTPAQANLPFEEINFQASDGTRLTGWLVSNSADAPVVLFCIGNAGNISHRIETLKLLHGMGASVFIFNYRGYGTSEGKANEQGLYSDISGAMSFLQMRGWTADRTILFGRSLGAAVALEAALQAPPAGLIMESAFTSIPAMGRHHYTVINFLLGWLVKAKFNNLEKIANLKSPLLIIHGSNDSICPPQMARELFANAPKDKAFLEIQDAEHNEAQFKGGGEYQRAIADALQSWVKTHP